MSAVRATRSQAAEPTEVDRALSESESLIALRSAAGAALIATTVVASLIGFLDSLAIDLAPIRVNLVAPGFVDTPRSAALLGDGLEARRAELRAKLPIGRVVGPADVAALAVHLMINTAVTGATYDIDGGQQFVA